jgi:tetratricopeptide (TPR) repeat protein
LSGFIYPASGNYEKALEEAQTALELRPDTAVIYSMVAYNEVALGRLQEAEEILRIGAERNMETPESVVLKYNLAYLQGDGAGMERAGALALRKAIAGDGFVYNQASVLASSGRLREALSMALRAEELAKQAAHPESAALFQIGSALWQAFDGDLHSARKGAIAALQLSRDREALYGAALALAVSGDTVRARIITDELQKRFPEDTSVLFSYLPTLHAALALSQGDPSKALQALEIATPYELGTHRSSIHGNFGALYPVYLRGQAYLAAHRGDEAAAEFRKILGHRGVVLSDPVGALAHLQLGRAYAMQSNLIEARTAYQGFFGLWNGSEPGVPILAKARKEYAELR